MEIRRARRGWYANLTHIDHQIRVVIGLLREQGLLDNTIIGFVCDHGDMLGDHHQWAKGLMYEAAVRAYKDAGANPRRDVQSDGPRQNGPGLPG